MLLNKWEMEYNRIYFCKKFWDDVCSDYVDKEERISVIRDILQLNNLCTLEDIIVEITELYKIYGSIR